MRLLMLVRQYKYISQYMNRCRSTISHEKTVDLSYSEYGSGNKHPLIMVHGLFGNKQNLNSLAKRLSRDGRKVVTVCCRNHDDSGKSNNMDYHLMAGDLECLLDKLKLDKVVLLGHSMGGKIVMTSALKHPDRLQGLVVVDVCPSVSPSGHLESYARKMREIQLKQGLSLSRARQYADEELESVVKDKIVRDFLLTNLIADSKTDELQWRVNLDAIISNFQTILSFPTDLQNKTFTKPTLFIGGTRSPQITGETIPIIKGNFPTCDIEMVEGAGHWLHSEKPSQFLQIVKEFLVKKDL